MKAKNPVVVTIAIAVASIALLSAVVFVVSVVHRATAGINQEPISFEFHGFKLGDVKKEAGQFEMRVVSPREIQFRIDDEIRIAGDFRIRRFHIGTIDSVVEEISFEILATEHDILDSLTEKFGPPHQSFHGDGNDFTHRWKTTSGDDFVVSYHGIGMPSAYIETDKRREFRNDSIERGNVRNKQELFISL